MYWLLIIYFTGTSGSLSSPTNELRFVEKEYCEAAGQQWLTSSVSGGTPGFACIEVDLRSKQ